MQGKQRSMARVGFSEDGPLRSMRPVVGFSEDGPLRSMRPVVGYNLDLAIQK